MVGGKRSRCVAGSAARMMMMFQGGAGARIRAATLVALSIFLSLVVTCYGQTLVTSPPPLGTFPSVANSTILFLHVFKCGGTSLRQVFMSLAETNKWSGAVVPGCHRQQTVEFYNPPGGYLCITHENQIVDKERGKWLVGGIKVLAGHFLWDFRTYVTQPYLLLTTLRNPLELMVSGVQFKHRNETQTLEEAAPFVERAMLEKLSWEDHTQVGFIRGFLDNAGVSRVDALEQGGIGDDEYAAMTRTAAEHLGTFFVVGVVEQYAGFIHVLRRTLDPELEHPSIWEEALEIRNNGSPVSSKDVLNNIDPDVVRRFNESGLGYQWKLYEVALQLWDTRCREVLPVSDHDSLCAVPGNA